MVPSNPLQSETDFKADTAIRQYPLADRFIFVGTDSVWVNDSLLDPTRYAIDYSRGTITLSAPLPESAPVRVRYQRLPKTDLRTSYSFRPEPSETPGGPGARGSGAQGPEGAAVPQGQPQNPRTPESLPGQEAGSELSLNGAKTFTVGFGSSGLDLDQSLRLNLEGSIAGVGIDAALSDQGAGLNAEGTTLELSDLDQVLINLHGSHLRGSLGDIDFLEPQGRLGTVSRELRGADVAWHSANDTSASGDDPGAQVGFSYARPKGRFGHNEFNGTDGLQGPYPLTGDMPGIALVAGSERVYLDGRQLVRGWDHDYTIDYDQAELTFTNQNQITALSRIEIDFQYTTDEYNRTMLAGTAGYNFGAARILAGAFTEADDPNAHIGRQFTQAETETLALAPDTDVAWLPGADSVGPGNGDYVPNGTHYDYVGPDSGTYSLYFARVPDSTGDYIYDNSIAAWRYVGIPNGDYVARQQVRLPERSEAYHADLSWQLLSGLDLDLTAMLTRLSRNLFAAAPLRNGFGYDASLGWQRALGGVLYQRRSLLPGFDFPAMTPEQDFDYTWDVTQVPTTYTRDQVTAYLKPWTPVRLDAFAGWLRTPATSDQPTATSLDRKRASLQVSAWFADYTIERIGTLTRQGADLTPRVRNFYPAVLLRYENDTLHRLLQTTPELAWKPGDQAQLKLSWQRTQQTSHPETMNDERSTTNENLYQADGTLTAVRNLNLQAIAGFQQSSGDTNRPGDGSQSADSGSAASAQVFFNLVTSYSSPAGLRATVNLDQKYKQEPAQQQQFVPTTPGKGKYSRNPQTGQYYLDTLGSYNQIIVNTGPTIPARETNLDFSAGLTSSRWLNLDLSGQLDQEVGDSGTMLDNSSVTTTFDFLPYSKQLSATFEPFNTSASFDRLYSASPERDFQNQASLELRTSASDNLTGKARLEMPYVRDLTETGQLKEQETGLQGSLSPTLGSGLNLQVTGGYGVSTYRFPLDYPGLGRFQVRTITLGFSRRFEFLNKTALTADAQIDRRDATTSPLPFQIQLTDPLGWSEQLTLDLDRMLGSVLVLSGNYTFRKRPDQAAENDVSVSLKAYF